MGLQPFRGSERHRERPAYTGMGSTAETLFDRVVEPRAKRNATPASHQAAQRATAKAADWTRLALALYASGLELTPDECSARISWQHERNIKPRISNLRTRGYLETTGEQRSFSHGDIRRGPGDVLRVTDVGLVEYRRRAQRASSDDHAA